MCVCLLSHSAVSVSFVTPWTVALQSPLSMGLSWQEYWSGLPFPLTGDLPDPGIEPSSPVSPALASMFFTTEPLVRPPHEPHLVTDTVSSVKHEVNITSGFKKKPLCGGTQGGDGG